MKTFTRTLALAVAASALSTAAQAQTFSTVASEDFESYAANDNLGDKSGGLYWFSNWWSGGTQDDAVVTAPGLGSSTLTGTTNLNDAGSYRSPKTGPWVDTVAPNFQFGGDSGTMWISFNSQRVSGGDDQYGGLSLNLQFVGEKLFLGSPWQTGEWGIAGSSVVGSDVTQDTRLVYKIEYQSGDENVSLWINPTVAHPDPLVTPPDLTTTVTDHTWNEIRLQSGGFTTTQGWHFDEILIECQDCLPPSLTSDITQISVSAGGTQNLTLQAGLEREGDFFLLLGSLSGTSPGFPLGLAGTLPLNFDPYFNHTLTLPNTPPLTGGFGVLDLDGKGFAAFSIPSGANPSLAGLTANHAYAVIQASPVVGVTFVSIAEACALVN